MWLLKCNALQHCITVKHNLIAVSSELHGRCSAKCVALHPGLDSRLEYHRLVCLFSWTQLAVFVDRKLAKLATCYAFPQKGEINSCHSPQDNKRGVWGIELSKLMRFSKFPCLLATDIGVIMWIIICVLCRMTLPLWKDKSLTLFLRCWLNSLFLFPVLFYLCSDLDPSFSLCSVDDLW